MEFKWRNLDDKSNEKYLNLAATFRINAVSRIIANNLQVPEEDIWWLVLIDPAIKQPGGGEEERKETYSIQEIYEFGVEAGYAEYLTIPPTYGKEFRAEPAQGPITLYARRDYINHINSLRTESGVQWLEVGGAYRSDDLVMQDAPFLPSETAATKVPCGTVIVAVIDNGMAVGHELFRRKKANGKTVSRVDHFWNMDGSGVDTSALPNSWTEPTPTGIGWTRKGLTKRLRHNMHEGLLDDPAFYASIGSTDWGERHSTPVAHRKSHGTHVMGLCAGYPTTQDTVDDIQKTRPIIAVNLRASEVKDPSGGLFVHSLEQAFVYIMDSYKTYVIADGPNAGEAPPMVVNFSFGNFAGPHDGTSLIEREISVAIANAHAHNPDCQFVLPAGNSNQSRCHARVLLTKSTPSRTLNWQVQPGDHSTSDVELWLDDDANGQTVTLTVQGPGGINPVELKSDSLLDAGILEDDNGNFVGVAYYVSPDISIYNRGLFAVFLYSTTHPDDVGPFAPAGAWALTLKADDTDCDIGLNLWVERDETLPGYSEFGRQSYFNDPDYARFYEPGVDADPLDQRLIGGPLGYDPENTTALVRRTGTLSGFAGGNEATLVAGFVQDRSDPEDSPMSLYSSTGLDLNGVNVYPDVSARSDDSEVMRGVLSAGSASGSFVALDGTSVAAPQVARWFADELSKGMPNAPDICAAAKGMDPILPPPAQNPPEIRSGCGRMLDLSRLFGRER